MFGKTDLQTAAARFGTSAAFAALEELARIKATTRRERIRTAVYAVATFAVAFAAATFIGV